MDKNILILDGDPEKCAKMYPDGLILKAQREIICLITPCDYLKNLYEFLCYEYQKRFGKKSRYLSRWKISEIKEVQVNQERNKLYELVGKGERIEWRLDVPEWWNRQENKGRLWCKNKKRNQIKIEEIKLKDKSEFREVLKENKKISKENNTKKIPERILTQKYLEGEDCYKLITENLQSKLEENQIQEIRKSIKVRLGGKSPNKKVVKDWIYSEYPTQSHIEEYIHSSLAN